MSSTSKKLDSGLRRNDESGLVQSFLKKLWETVRELSGDDAYERYLAHHAACHAGTPPLSRKEYFRRSEEMKWGGIRRCC